ncbi:MAG: sigma-70 family RNA polymerase sigma factor [Chloroflexi bacterium]|nr:sigma-70 family RNA polymerase sigma factor [Chloroflexota bacterium]
MFSGERKEDATTGVDGEMAAAIRRAKSYDRAAFADIYRFAIVPIHRYVAARTNTVEEAEDLTQEVFIAALAGIGGLRTEDEAGLLSWLFQIARHKLADRLRQRYRRPVAPIEDAGELEAWQPSPDELAEAAEERAQLRQALGHLTDEQRDVIVYKFVLGYDNERTSRLLGKSINAVNQLQHRALASLHRVLQRTEKVR